MYIPAANKIEDPIAAIEAMRRNPFATLVSIADSEPVATHVPLIVKNGESVVLCGHIARQNSQWRSWNQGVKVLAIFSGPHGYVSPRYYVSRPNVPTWNYVSVHAYGLIEIVEDESEAIEHLEELVSTFDPGLADVQPESMDRAFFKRLLPGVVVFRVHVDRIQAKAKLSQNKSEADQLSVWRQFTDSTDEVERRMAELMPIRPPRCSE